MESNHRTKEARAHYLAAAREDNCALLTFQDTGARIPAKMPWLRFNLTAPQVIDHGSCISFEPTGQESTTAFLFCDLTNLATVKDWPLIVTVVDMI